MHFNDQEFFDFINAQESQNVASNELQEKAVDCITSLLALYYKRLIHYGMSDFAAAMLTEAYYKNMVERTMDGK